MIYKVTRFPKNQMKKTIYMYASLPKNEKIPFGGGEIGNLRTLNMLRNAGYNVITIRHRKASVVWGRIRILFTYPFRILLGWSDTFLKLLFASRRSIVHFSAFAGKTIFNEYVLMHIMKMLGYKVVYELRGGGAVEFWEEGSLAYRKMFGYLLNNACCVFVQGKENIPLIESISETPVYHYANYVENGFAPKVKPKKPINKIKLIFYGRCEEDKHVDLIVKAASLVQKEIPNVHLTIVGDGRQSYIDMIKEMMQTMLIENSYSYLPNCRHSDLPSLLFDKHFYIFPTTQPREGQSNSITECMSFGIVPIASPQGFNRSTIGDDNLIINKLEPKLYADKILEIIQKGKFEFFSYQVYNRFCENFTEDIVKTRALNQYKIIMYSNSCG